MFLIFSPFCIVLYLHAIFSHLFFCLNCCNLSYCHILSNSVFSIRYFYISLRHICLFIRFNAVGVNFVLIAFLFYCT